MPDVSVIVPNYNHSQYLKTRIDSILSQTYSDIEVIILDDSSTDNSREIIETYRNHPLISSIIYNEENSGSTFLQWEKGINLAKGEFIWIAESDDWCEPTFLEYLLPPLKASSDCLISYCQSYTIDGENKILWQSSHGYLNEDKDGKQFIKSHLLYNNSIFNASMAVWRKDRFYSVSREFLNFRYCGDWLFWIELSSMGKVAVNGRILNYFRNHGGDVSNKATASGLHFVENMKVINWLYHHGYMSDKEYWKAAKKQYREYWPLRKEIREPFSGQIKALFSDPEGRGTSEIKLIIDAMWKSLKKNSRKN